jgi:hypothetical protein
LVIESYIKIYWIIREEMVSFPLKDEVSSHNKMPRLQRYTNNFVYLFVLFEKKILKYKLKLLFNRVSTLGVTIIPVGVVRKSYKKKKTTQNYEME